MATTTSYNLRSPAVKRLLQEARELQQDKCSDYTAQPLEVEGIMDVFFYHQNIHLNHQILCL